MSWPIVALVSVISALATLVYLFHVSQRPLRDKRIAELEKRLATAQAKIAAIEAPSQSRAVPFPFSMAGPR